MAISNGYTTLAEVKAILNPLGLATQATDDAVIEDWVEGASRYIDSETHKTFYARTETRYFDIPAGRELTFDDWLLSITTFNNGDGVAIASTEYNFEPRNRAPYYSLRLKEMSSVVWKLDSSGNAEDVLSIVGSWGWSTTAPDNIRMACQLIVVNMYRSRYGNNTTGAATITGAGVVITPKDIPTAAVEIISKYMPLTPNFY